jgi:hypothetical protein
MSSLRKQCESRDDTQYRVFAGSNFKQLTPMSSPGLTGRSSIPETARAYSRHHGVLDAPPEAGHDKERNFAFSPRLAPEFYQNVPLSEIRGRRECRAPDAPAASCAVCR